MTGASLRLGPGNKHLGNGDYLEITASSSHPLFLTEQAANGVVEAPLNEI